MLVHEKNDGKPVQSECAIILRPEGVQIVERDKGILFDIAEDENTITSLTSYVVSLYNKNYFFLRNLPLSTLKNDCLSSNFAFSSPIVTSVCELWVTMD